MRAGGSLLPPALMPIHVEPKYIAPADSTLPALALQATHLVNSYMIWIGCTDVPEESVQLAPLRGSLAKDWACAMPPSSVRPLGPDSTPPRLSFLTKDTVPAAATSLFVSSSSADLALAMAQRLGDDPFLSARAARPLTTRPCIRRLGPLPGMCVPGAALRFKRQIFLSVDVPPAYMTMGDGPRLMLAVEKGVVDYLKAVEQNRP